MTLGGCYFSREMLEDPTMAPLVVAMMLEVADSRGVAVRPIELDFARAAELDTARRERDDFEQRLHAYQRGEIA